MTEAVPAPDPALSSSPALPLLGVTEGTGRLCATLGGVTDAVTPPPPVSLASPSLLGELTERLPPAAPDGPGSGVAPGRVGVDVPDDRARRLATVGVET